MYRPPRGSRGGALDDVIEQVPETHALRRRRRGARLLRLRLVRVFAILLDILLAILRAILRVILRRLPFFVLDLVIFLVAVFVRWVGTPSGGSLDETEREGPDV